MWHRLLCAVTILTACTDELELSEHEEALTCDVGAFGAFGNACSKASDPLAITAAPFTGTAPRIRLNERAYGVRLVTVGSSNQGKVAFTVPATGTFHIYTGSNVPIRVVRAGQTVTPSCTSSISSSECSYLRKVVTVSMAPADTVEVHLGPTTASYVRFHVQAEIEPLPVCTAADLAEEQLACSPSTNTITAHAVSRTTSLAPSLALDTVYTVKMPASVMVNGEATYGGIVKFKPPTDGIYELYYGTPYIPLRVLGSVPHSTPATATCSRYIPSSECAYLRRGTRLSLRAADTYYLEIGPDEHPSVRVTIRKN